MWGGTGGARIFNLMTQEGGLTNGAKPGKASLANANHCLRHLRQAIEKEGITSLALPKLATGVGGLDWDSVRPLIAQHLGDLGIPIYLYTTYRKGHAAAEPGLAVPSAV